MWPSYLIAGWIFVPFVGIGCVLGGYWALVKWIPAETKKDEVRNWRRPSHSDAMGDFRGRNSNPRDAQVFRVT